MSVTANGLNVQVPNLNTDQAIDNAANGGPLTLAVCQENCRTQTGIPGAGSRLCEFIFFDRSSNPATCYFFFIPFSQIPASNRVGRSAVIAERQAVRTSCKCATLTVVDTPFYCFLQLKAM